MKKIVAFLLLLVGFSSFAQKINFNAKGILAISDADMRASAFNDGKLLRDKGNKDHFVSIKFPPEIISDELKSVVVSNSAVNGAKSLAISSNNKLAYILETRGQITENAGDTNNSLTDLPAGGFVTVVDITDLSQPKLLYKFPVGRNPTSIDIDKSGEYLVVATEEVDKELQVLELDAHGKPIRIINKPYNLPVGKISDVTWHPGNEYIAFTLEESREVGLIKLYRDGPTTKIMRLDLMGKPTQVGNFPGAGQFTPDGNLYIVPDLKKGSNAANETGYDGKGEIFVMKFNLENGEHHLYSKIKVGENIQSFAISPDGTFLVVVNANKSIYAWNNPQFSQKSSLSLVKLSSDGKLEKTGDYEFDGILPQNITFDDKGENIAVTIFDYPTYGKHFGGIDFWKVNKGNTPSLQKQESKFFMPRGCHGLKIVK